MDLRIIYIFALLFYYNFSSADEEVENNNCRTHHQDLINKTKILHKYQINSNEIDIFIKTGNLLINCNNISSLKNDIQVNNSVIKILNCPFPKNSYYNTYFTKLNIESVNTLIIQNVTTRNNTLTNVVFQNFNHIKVLHINNAHITEICSGLFKHLKNIQTLIITNNNFTSIKKYIFSHSDISIINLRSNNIKYIENGSFINLNNLKKLYLNENNLNLFYDSFKGLLNLNILNLTSCYIKSVNFLHHLFNLKVIDLSKNKLNYITDIDFQNNSNLEIVILSNNKNLSLDDNVFKSLKNISVIKLDDNNLSTIPQSVKKLSELKELYLQNNKIKEIEKACFAELSELRILNLENNLLVNINEKIFENLTFLGKLNLKGNIIREVHRDAFFKSRFLREVILSNNYLNLKQLNLFGIEKLDLSYNLFQMFPVLVSTPFGYNVTVNISNNQISNIENYLIGETQSFIYDFSNNNIRYLNLKKSISQINGTLTITLTNNPIVCDCHNFGFIEFLKNNVSINKKIYVKFEQLKCSEPEQLKNTDVINVNLNELMCNLNNLSYSCSDLCDCNWRPLDNNVIIDCSNRSLKNIPKLNITKHINLRNQLINIFSYEIYLNKNSLEIISPFIYENIHISILDFSYNNIKYITWIPSKIKELRLDHNKIQSLDEWVLEILERTKILNLLTLHYNPWICNCDTDKLQNFLINLRHKINISDVRCNTDEETIISVKWLCFSRDIIYIYVLVSLGLVIFIILQLRIFYFRYRLEINVWLNAHNLYSWFLKEDKPDKDKKFDIFLSFSHKDIEYVTNTLLPILEERNCPFSVCLHDRNFIPGYEISSNIINSVISSRRTLIILSNNFLESYWGKLEFRTAHTEAMREGRARVILIIYGELCENKLDGELKAYFKTNTYIRWDDPLFENRLIKALPDRRHSRNYQFSELAINNSSSASI